MFFTNTTDNITPDNNNIENNSLASSEVETRSYVHSDIGQVAGVDEEVIDMREFAFSPSDITIKVGTTVTWTNRDKVRHNVVFDHGGGPLLAEGESYEDTFDKVGEYSYYCSPHPFMRARINVVE